MDECVFCQKIATGDYEHDLDECVAFTPLDPVTPGHMLVVPREHVTDALDRELVTAETMRQAVSFAKYELIEWPEGWNFITSVGEVATQSVFHLHIHLVPRRPGDGLHLPWTGQVRAGAQ